ncbi:hypothetical protein MBH78_06155 [Oceanimonas sp. NS1]|nr:hypothetical protein [Oceanimonas sp. NS1]
MEQTLILKASRPWGRWLLIGTGVVLTLLLLVVPLFAILPGPWPPVWVACSTTWPSPTCCTPLA